MQEGSEAFARLAQDYARFRPGYPVAILQELADACGLTPAWAVADIGSGTGNLARLFLDAGHTVVGIEPNRQMREAGERHLAPYPAFRSLDGSAEDIPLPPQSVDLVTVGQALHWFDIERAKGEFRRILRGGRQVAVAWNDRRPDPEGFFEGYRALTRDCLNHVPTSFQRPLSAGLDRLFEVLSWRVVKPPA